MKAVVAPNAFKGSLTARQAAEAMAAGVRRAVPDAEVALVPVADGGDGLVAVLADALGGEILAREVHGPRVGTVRAEFLYLAERRTAVIEMALASGLALLPDAERDPTQTTTFGTGELIAAALELGARRILLGLGGSATTDGGIGLAAALGARFLDSAGTEVRPVGGEMNRIERIDLEPLRRRLAGVAVEGVCDVDNPLLGPRGAAHVYGPQKGATPAQVKELDAGLARLAQVVARDLGREVAEVPGAGAAGGLGAGLMAFLDATLRPGVAAVLDLVGLEENLQAADLVLTAEGRIDGQTACGKAPAGVAAAARQAGIPCLALAGGLGEGVEELHAAGIAACFTICPGPVSLEQAMRAAGPYLTAATEQAVRAFLAGRGL